MSVTYLNAVGERGFNAVQVSQRTQKIVAIICGLLLLSVVLAIILSKTRSNNTNDSNTSNAEVQAPQVSKKSTDSKISESPKPSSVPEVTTQPEDNNADKKKPVVTDTKPTNEKYTFTAVSGDSYTVLARSAVTQYAEANKLTITDIQKQQAEADLAVRAGSPFLEIGQVVIIQKSDISEVLKIVAPVIAEPKESELKVPKEEKKSTDAAKDQSFNAISGDSYSLLTRKAISVYASNSKLTLSPTQRIAAETTIIAAAGFPAINVGQLVTFTHVSIKDAVEAAQDLSVDQLSNWQPYANLVSF